MLVYSDDLELDINDFSDVRIIDTDEDWAEVYLRNKLMGHCEIFTDKENQNREYICINYTICYLDEFQNYSKINN